jgi:hypothetical protein
MAENDFERIRDEYLLKLRRQLYRVPSVLREDAIREVQAHIEDGCRQYPGDVPVLQSVLERLGPPEGYGRELGLQLLLQARRNHPSLSLLLWTAVFFTTTSVGGFFVVTTTAIGIILGLAFLFDGLIRLLRPSNTFTLIRINDTIIIPPLWNPVLNMVIGVLALYLFPVGWSFLEQKWIRGKLGQRGLAVALKQETVVFPRDWERRTTWAIVLIALLGLTGCSIFGVAGGLFPIGTFGSMSLPEDFFKNALTFLAFLASLVFLFSPVLGILWVTWREQRKDRLDQDGPSNK